MPTAIFAPNNANVITVSIDPTTIASDTTRLAGVKSSVVDLAGLTPYPENVAIGGKFTTGGTVTAGRVIELAAVASLDGTNWQGPFGGSAGTATISSTNLKNLICRPVVWIDVTSTANFTYEFGPVPLLSLFGYIPPAVQFFLAHDCGGTLHGTLSNHVLQLRPLNGNATW